MSREVIQDFLNLAGVVGIALTNRRMRPYFYGLDAVLDRTKQALGQGVLQVVENVPDGFESFEFHFGGHVVYIYKLTHGLVLLVLTDSSLKLIDYRRSITKVKYLIETDTYNTVSYFKLLLGSVTQHSLPSTNWQSNNQPNNPPNSPKSAEKQTSQTTIQDQQTTHSFTNLVSNSTITSPSSGTNSTSAPQQQTITQTNTQTNKNAQSTIPTAKIASQNITNQNVETQPNNTKPKTPPTVTSTTTARSANITKAFESSNSATSTSPTNIPANAPNNSVSAKTQEYKLDELLAALNKLSSFTTQYLGKVVVTNYWKSSRPDSSWLAEFEIDRSGQISHPKQKAIACTPEQHQQIQSWVTAYIKRCKQVIRNFDQMLEQDCLDTNQRQMLL